MSGSRRQDNVDIAKFRIYAFKMSQHEVKHGGPNRGQGRKPLDPNSSTVSFPVKMSLAQREKLKRLGGAQWVRERIDNAKAPISDE